MKSLTEATKSLVEEDPEKETKMNVARSIEMARSGFELIFCIQYESNLFLESCAETSIVIEF